MESRRGRLLVSVDCEDWRRLREGEEDGESGFGGGGSGMTTAEEIIALGH